MSDIFHKFNLNSKSNRPAKYYLKDIFQSSKIIFQQGGKGSTQLEKLIIYEDYPSDEEFLSLVSAVGSPKESELDNNNFYEEDHSYAMKMLSHGIGNICCPKSENLSSDTSETESVGHYEIECFSNSISGEDSVNFSESFLSTHSCDSYEDIVSHVTARKKDSISHSLTGAKLKKFFLTQPSSRETQYRKDNYSKKYKKSRKNKKLPSKMPNIKTKCHKIMSNETDPLSLPCEMSCFIFSPKNIKSNKTSYLVSNYPSCRKKALADSEYFLNDKDNFEKSELSERIKRISDERVRRSTLRNLLNHLASEATENIHSNKMSTIKVLHNTINVVNAYKEIDFEKAKNMKLLNKLNQLLELES